MADEEADNNSKPATPKIDSGDLWKLGILLVLAIVTMIIVVIGLSLVSGLVGNNSGGNLVGSGSQICGTVPPEYQTIFEKAGDKWKVQSAFIAAIFYAGEHANSWPNINGPWASSPKGAQGPFQFMPATWNSNKQDGDGDGKTDVQNIWDSSFGAAYLFANLGAGGNTDNLDTLMDAASKYNSGRPWSIGQGIPETAKYVPRVIAAYQSFKCEQGSGIALGKFIWPVKGRLTTRFGERDRVHRNPHTGLDIAVVRGTPIKAADGGVVEKVNLDRSDICGVYVKVKHDGGLETVYCHMIEDSPTTKGIKEGVKVSQGQILGEVNSTGRSTGNHLHFGVQSNGKFIDPESLLPPQ